MIFDLAARSLLVFAMCCACAVPAANASTFEFFFDGIDDGIVDAPFVGSGSMSFNESLGDGTYAFNSLSDVSINFLFGADAFKEVDIVTPLDEVLIVISMGGQSLNFSNVNDFGGGPYSGALDFISPGNSVALVLTTEPPGTGGNLDRYATVDADGNPQYFGNYGSQLVPEPMTGIPALLGFSLALLFRRRRSM